MPTGSARIGFLYGYLAYEYETAMWRGLLRAAQSRGVELIAIECSADPAERPGAKLLQRSLIEGLGLHGMIVSGVMGFTFFDERVEELLSTLPPVPKVLIARSFAGHPSVFVDNRAGIAAMVDHLVEVHGRRRIAFVAGHAHGGDAIQRRDAYRNALERHGMAYDPGLVYQPNGEYNPYAGAQAVDAIWSSAGKRPDAFVANNDDAAISAVRELTRLGIRVPGEVSVTGFDDIAPCLEVSPHITTVRQPHGEIGATAIDLVLACVAGRPVDSAPVLVPGAPVFRQSCGCSNAKATRFSRSFRPAGHQDAPAYGMIQLEESLETSLASSNPDVFLDALDAAVAEGAADPLFETWLDTVKSLFDRHGGEKHVAQLYEAAIERLAHVTNVIERSRAAEARSSYNVLNDYFSSSVFSFDNADLGETLLESLPRLGVHEFLLCTQEDGSPVARVKRLSFNGGTSELLEGTEGTPGHLVAAFMSSHADRGGKGPLVLMRLHHSGTDLGFIICAVSRVDGSLYLSLQSQLSSRLKGNALLEAVRGHARDLENKVKTLSGFIPICASCKKVRDDKGYWSQVEAYISEHSEVEFSHGICPDCARALYPDLKVQE